MGSRWRHAARAIGAGAGLIWMLNVVFAQDWQAGAPPEWSKVMSAAKAEGKVVVAGHPALARSLAEGFKRDTGIELDYLGGNVRELAARFRREILSNNQTIDILLGGGTELVNLYPEGKLTPIKPQLMLPGVADPKNWLNGGIKWMDKEKAHFFQGSKWVHAWPLVNSDLVKPDTVRSWKDFLKPEFKGRIAASDPRTGGPGQSAAAYLADTFGIDFVKALYVGQEVTYTRDGRQLVEWIARGNYTVALGSVQIDIENFKKNGIRNLSVLDLADGPGSLLGGFGVLKQAKGVPHPNAATVFTNWYASKPGQEIYTRTMLEPSTRVDVEVPTVPDYVKPKQGVRYLDQYDEPWYTDVRPKLEKSIVDALGGL